MINDDSKKAFFLKYEAERERIKNQAGGNTSGDRVNQREHPKGVLPCQFSITYYPRS
jgi:hypothetical protein